jgi:hypothetical protein
MILYVKCIPNLFFMLELVLIRFRRENTILMKKVWKYLLISLLVLILGAGGTIYYFLNIKTYETADKEIEKITESEYEIDLPDIEEPVAPIGDDSNTESNDDTSDSNTNTNTDTNTGNTTGNGTSTGSSDNKNDTNTGGNTDNNTSPSKPEVTVAVIKDTYRPVFESLESQANAKIDGLVNRAIGEYQQKKNSGESISYAYFFQKYTSAGNDLESKTDEAFNYVYSALQDSLKKHGYSPNHAKEFKEQYENAKSARESALLNKAKEAL